MAKKRILVVDDEDELVRAVEIRLKQADYEVLTAYDGMEALDKARREKPDLIILDLMLPKMDGYKVSAMLKHDGRYANIPIIMLTARVHEDGEGFAYESGADAYLAKPFESQLILAKIKELLERS